MKIFGLLEGESLHAYVRSRIEKSIYYSFLAIVIWLLIWWIIYKLSGFHVRSISINNGISFNGVYFQGNAWEIDVRYVRFRLWGNSRMLIIGGLTLKRDMPYIANKTSEYGNGNNDSNARRKLVALWSNKAVKFMMKHIVHRVPGINIEIKELQLITEEMQLSSDYMRFHFTCNLSKELNLPAVVLKHVIEGLKFGPKDSSSKVKLPDGKIETSRLQISFVFDSKKETVSNVRLSLFTIQLSLSLKLIIRQFLSSNFDTYTSHKELTLEESRVEQSKCSFIVTFLHDCVDEISLRTEDFELTGIPVYDSENQLKYSSGTDLLTNTSLTLRSKLVYFNIQKLDATSAGYHVLFKDDESAFEASCCIQSCTLSVINNSNQSTTDTKLTGQIIRMPNFNFTHKSNAFHHLLRDEVLNDVKVELYASMCNPIVDMDLLQVTTLLFTFVTLMNRLEANKRGRSEKGYPRSGKEDTKINTEASNVDLDETTCDLDSENERAVNVTEDDLKRRLISLVLKYYPRVDIKFIIEQPRIVIRAVNEDQEKELIFTLTYSLINFHLRAVDAKNYEVKCDILRPSIAFQENSGNEDDSPPVDFAYLDFATIVLQMHKDSKVEGSLTVDGSFVNLSMLNILASLDIAFSSFLTNLDKAVSANDSIAIKYHDLNEYTTSQRYSGQKKKNGNSPQRIFKLPSWVSEMRLRILNTTLLLGSRTILLPGKTLGEKTYAADMKKDGQLRHIKITLPECECLLKNILHQDISPSESFSLLASTDTLNSKQLSGTPISVSADINKLEIAVFYDVNENPEMNEKLLSIPSAKLSFHSHENILDSGLEIDLQVENITFFVRSYMLSVVFGCFYVADELIIQPLRKIKDKFNLIKRFLPALRTNNEERTDIRNCSFSLALGQVDFTIFLSDDLICKLQLLRSNLLSDEKVLSVENDICRLMIKPYKKNQKWSRLACADNVKLNYKIAEEYMKVSADVVKLLQPHGFAAYMFFDNLSITIKIIKFFVESLKNGKSSQTVMPKKSEALTLPDIEIDAKRIFFNMEDDFFESELNMIFQLGLVEQRKRLELTSLFEQREKMGVKEKRPEDQEADGLDPLLVLHRELSLSWIRKVRAYKSKLGMEIVTNRKFLFGNEALLPSELNCDIEPYMQVAPLLLIIMSGIKVQISKPHFDMNELPNFLHRIGQGVPKTTSYSVILPMRMNVTLKELRMHLRDYPLPLLHVPDDGTKKSNLNLCGTLVIAESFVTDKKSMRLVKTPLIPTMSDVNLDKYSYLEIYKSLTPIKIFAEMDVKFSSRFPSRFVWGQSYLFGLQRVMQNLDQFSKPPVDPSPKLGFWDKLRLILHCKLNMLSGPQNGIEVAFKGSRDPYNLFGTGRGFVLAFYRNIQWAVNEHDDSRLLFVLRSDEVSWYVPNYLSMPLVSWTRESSKNTMFPESTKFISSCFAYYLQDSNYSSYVERMKKSAVILKNVISLNNISFEVGFILERETEEGNITNISKPHFDVNLYSPKFTKKDHDSYSGFRSKYIHMTISVVAKQNASKNSIHLSPGVFDQFFDWWKLFSGNMMLPICRGPLFGEKELSPKFSQHLFSNTFHFHIESIFVAHVLRENHLINDTDSIRFSGLRARMDDFLIDLHQRREPRIMIHEELEKNKRITKMNFNVGEVRVTGIDLRTVFGSFSNDDMISSDKESAHESIYISDKNEGWYDLEDFEEMDKESLIYCDKDIKYYPLMFSERFSYLRDTGDMAFLGDVPKVFSQSTAPNCKLDKQLTLEFNEQLLKKRILELENQKDSANPRIQKDILDRIDLLKEEIESKRQLLDESGSTSSKLSKSSKYSIGNTDFHNKFEVLCMYFKWNVETRDLLLKYIQLVQLNTALRKYLSYDSIATIENLVQKTEESLHRGEVSTALTILEELSAHKISTRNRSTEGDRNSRADKLLYSCAEDEMVSEDYLISIRYPQIQLRNSNMSDTVVLVSSPSINSKIVSITQKTEGMLANSKELEVRYGTFLKDASIFVVFRDQGEGSNNYIISDRISGLQDTRLPWLGIEACINSTLGYQKDLIVQSCNMFINYKQMKASSESDVMVQNKNESVYRKLDVDVPRFIIKSTSRQYFALYTTFFNLFFYVEPRNKEIQADLEKLKFSIDFQNLRAIHGRIIELLELYRCMCQIEKNYEFRKEYPENFLMDDYRDVKNDKIQASTEVYLLMHSILTGEAYRDDKSSSAQAEWNIRADEIILHMIEENRKPMLDLALARGRFARTLSEDGSNTNQLFIGMMQIFNLLSEAIYPTLLGPDSSNKDESDDLISVYWKMNKLVGGIRIMEHFDVLAQPLNINIDEKSGEKILNYIFPDNDNNDMESFYSSIEKMKLSGDGGSNAKNDNSNARQHPQKSTMRAQEGPCSKDSKHDPKKQNSNNSRAKMNDRSVTSPNMNKSEQDLEKMVERSKKYMSVVLFRMSPIILKISIKCQRGWKRLLNVDGFKLHLPEFVIRQKLLSQLEITMHLKKMILRTLVRHLGKLMSNKFKQTKQKSYAGHSLPSLKHYSKYLKGSDLADAESV